MKKVFIIIISIMATALVACNSLQSLSGNGQDTLE